MESFLGNCCEKGHKGNPHRVICERIAMENDTLLQHMLSEARHDRQRDFIQAFYPYLLCLSKSDYKIDTRDLYRWFGVADARELNVAVVENLRQKDHYVFRYRCARIRLNVMGLYQLCLTLNTPHSRRICKYYRIMQEQLIDRLGCFAM